MSDRTGIPRNTLITWERRHGLVRPARATNGYRLYSEADITHLLVIKKMLSEGHRIGDIAEREVLGAVDHYAPDRTELLNALLAISSTQARAIQTRLARLPFEIVIRRVYMPILRQIGEMWSNGEASVSQERFASTWVRMELQLMFQQSSGSQSGRRVLAAGYPGERHELGLLAIVVQLAVRGVQVTYLGTDVPVEDLVATCLDGGHDTLIQSLIMPRTRQEVTHHVNRIRTHLREDVVLLIGGPGTPRDLELGPGTHLRHDVNSALAEITRQR